MDMPLKRDPLWATSNHGRKSPRPRRPQRQRLRSRVPKTASGPLPPGLRSSGLQWSVPPQPCPGHLPTWGLARAGQPTTKPHTFSPSLTRCWPVCSPSYKMELESTAQPTSLGSRELRGVMAGFPRSFSSGSFVQESKVMTWLGKSSQTRG